MTTTSDQNYDWLPEELKATGVNEITGRRFYNGAPEVLEVMDRLQWPPEDPKNFFIWDRIELGLASGKILNLHLAHLLTQLLVSKTGSVSLGFFDWCWKSRVENYVKSLPPFPRGSIEKDFPTVFFVFNSLYLDDGTREMKDRNDRLDAGQAPDEFERFGDILDSLEDGNEVLRAALKDGGNQELRFIATQSDHPFLKYGNCDPGACGHYTFGASGTGLSRETELTLANNPALQLRLKLWWGWPDAEFPCIESTIKRQMTYLFYEEYIRQNGSEYELTDSGRKRLEGLILGGLLTTDFSKKFLRQEDLLWRA
jgi:hypothetical protein